MVFQTFLTSNDIYTPSDIIQVLEQVIPDGATITNNTKVTYYNIPCSFDIETSSFYVTINGVKKKRGIMYIWMFGINGAVIIGRKWPEFFEMLNVIAGYLKLSPDRRLLCYVHNLGFEFQWIRKWVEWEKIFAIAPRKPIYAVTTSGIEFRCSYLLAGYSLETVGKNLTKYPVKKLVGNLDYSLIRHSETPLSSEELAYCINDVKVVMAYIQEAIEQNGSIIYIPLTKTGYVRNYCRNSCFYEKGISRKKSFKRLNYSRLMSGMRLTPDEYNQLKRAFQGGFTHSNPFCARHVQRDVTSFDLISSYPAVMVAEKFPMSSSEKLKPEELTKAEFEKSLNLYCCVFEAEFVNLCSRLHHEHYISSSRCYVKHNVTAVNGRVVSADLIRITLTEQDYFIIKKFYTWDEDKFRITDFRRYMRDYLPTDFVKAILTLYSQKTILKGVEGKEIEYQAIKEMLNASFGMSVTDIVRKIIAYLGDVPIPDDLEEARKRNGPWKSDDPALEEAILKYNNNKSRFQFYPWGVFITSFARRNLFSGIVAFGEDYCYSDTDSLKVINAEKHLDYIAKYNDWIRQKLLKALDYHGLDPALIEPLTQKGEKKLLGAWDFDGHYSRFKPIRAKCYLVEYSEDKRNKPSDRGHINMTVSGLNKKTCVPYMLDKWGKDGVFDAFDDGLYIPAAYTGKSTHTYIDGERQGTVMDYLGVESEYYERSSIHMENAEYELSLSKEYADYLLNIVTEEE